MADDDQYPSDYEAIYDDEKTSGRVNWVRVIGSSMAIIIVAGFAGGIWYAYDQGVKKGVQLAPPIIKADSAPIKISPKDPGGMAIPHQDKKIFNVLKPEEEEPKVEKLMAPVEEATKEATPLEVPRSPEITAKKKPVEKLISKKVEMPKSVPATAKAALEKAKTAVEKTEVASPKAQTAPAKVVVVAPKIADKGAKMAIVQPKTVVDAGAAGAETKIYRVQLGAFRSKDAATKQWITLQKRHRTLLGKLPHNIQSVKITDKGRFFRLQAGRYTDRTRAAALCTELKTEKQDCLIAGS